MARVRGGGWEEVEEVEEADRSGAASDEGGPLPEPELGGSDSSDDDDSDWATDEVWPRALHPPSWRQCERQQRRSHILLMVAREQGRTAQGPTCSRADDPGRGVTVGDERSDDVDGCVCRTNIGTYGRLRGVDDAEEGFGDPVGVGERGREGLMLGIQRK